MAKNTTSKGKARKATKSVKAPVFSVPHDELRDALRGRHVNRFGLLSRTRAMHEALYSAYANGEGLTARQITEQATALMLLADAASGGNGTRADGSAIACRATNSHLNTMKGREFVTRENDRWQLTFLGARQCELELTPADRVALNAWLKAQKAGKGKPAADDKPKAKKARKAKAEVTADDDAGN